MSEQHFSWDEQSVEALRRMVRVEGKTFEAIGRELGISKNACIGKARRLGIEPTAETPLNQRQKGQRLPPLSASVRWAALDAMFPPKGHCVYPIGDPQEADFHFCGDAVRTPGESYCAEHHRICWQRVRATEQ
jgi:GcrA cell cycle regulator